MDGKDKRKLLRDINSNSKSNEPTEAQRNAILRVQRDYNNRKK